ncbi:hypothetical protein SUGI_1373320 [Cryptomeria japonica]|uniref:Uncharacterized protein n=1 Tax=Cryptomeria japonica TaxID=3369 RepID=A0AAD3RQL3_CRYJA|nr:hypothetical protein SUGI_1373320 [Cryptomeria japonica]
MLLLFLVLALGQQEKLSQQGQKLDQLLGQQATRVAAKEAGGVLSTDGGESMDSAASFTAASPVFYVAFASSAGCTAASISAVCSSNPVFSAASYSAPSTLAT